MKKHPAFIGSIITLACTASVWAARPIDLDHQPVSFLQSFATTSTMLQISRATDFNQTTHVRSKQMYAGYPVWGADAIVHTSQYGKTFMNGLIYQDLNKDLNNTPSTVFSSTQAAKVLQHLQALYQQRSGKEENISDSKAELMVYVDKSHQAHWAFLASFLVQPVHAVPAKPTFIIDAVTFQVYEEWDNIQTFDDTLGGGFGGNLKMGKLSYDNLQGDLPALNIERDILSGNCYLENASVKVEDTRKKNAIVQFPCTEVDSQHNKIYWDADADAVNDAYSPSNDALYAGKVIKEMYQQWYNVPVLVKNGKPMMLVMRVHEEMENAYWDGKQMTFGDGGTSFYPLVSLGVGGHEISHGFTQQHSNLVYRSQSGGLNESFSDMAAQAAEYFAYGHNSWQIGPEIYKANDEALRYMDDPTKDCQGKQPGRGCSIANVKEYHEGLDVHYSSGIFNKIFYLMGTAPGWDTKKAFDVMVKANEHYWLSTTTFVQAACGVLKATDDYGYDVAVAQLAMNEVGIDISQC